MTTEIITSSHSEVNAVLRKVAPDFPEKVASVIEKSYPNPQVVQMISSQIDADRMDYLLRDSYFTGTNYGTFDLTRILRVMKPYADGISFDMSGMHAVEDYIVSRFQMYQQVYFHPVSRSIEVILSHLLKRAKYLYKNGKTNYLGPTNLLFPFFEGDFSLSDYLKLDDGVLNSYFSLWQDSDDKILSDLADRFLNRKPFKSVRVSEDTRYLLPTLRKLVADAGFDSEYYTATNDSFDLPYDTYSPSQNKHRTQIELMQKDGLLVELSQVSNLVAAISGKVSGDERFFFPKEMKSSSQQLELFSPIYSEFQSYLKNDTLIKK